MGKKKNQTRTVKLTFYLTEREQARLLRAVEEDKNTLSPFVRRAVMLMVDEIELTLKLPRVKLSQPPGTRATDKDALINVLEAEEETELTRIVLD